MPVCPFWFRQGLDAEYLISPDRGLPVPDVTLFLAATTSETSTRGGFGEERFVICSMLLSRLGVILPGVATELS